MAPTDTDYLNWILATMDGQNAQAYDALQAAYTFGFKGRKALAAAMEAVFIEPGDTEPPRLTAIDLVRMELGRREAGVTAEEDNSERGLLVQLAAKAILELDDLIQHQAANDD